MRLGACGYIRNPFDDNDVKAPVSRALHYRPTTSRYDTGWAVHSEADHPAPQGLRSARDEVRIR